MRKMLLALTIMLLAMGMVLPATAQDAVQMDVWLFQSFVTDANDVLEGQVLAWAEENNVEVSIDFSTFNDRGPKYVAAVQSGELPDVGEIDFSAPLRFRNQLTDVSDVVADVVEVNGAIIENVDPIVSADGTYFAVPRYALTSAMFIRSDIMEEAGLEPPTTWEEFEAFVIAINNPDENVYGLGQTLNRSQDGTQFLNSLLWSYGGGLFNEMGEPTAASEANVEAMNYAVSMINDWGATPPDVMTWGDSTNNENYLAGNIAVTFNGASLYYAMVTNETTLEDGTVLMDNTLVLPWPEGPAGRVTTSIPYSWGVFDNGDPEKVELAKDLIRFLEQPEQFNEYLAVSVGQAGPVYEGRFENEYWEQDPNFDAILTSIRDGVVLGFPGDISLAAVEAEGRQLLVDAAGNAVIGGFSVEESLELLQEELQGIVESAELEAGS